MAQGQKELQEIMRMYVPVLNRFRPINIAARLAAHGLGYEVVGIYPPIGFSEAARRAAHKQHDRKGE
jgi:hypothetical protein